LAVQFGQATGRRGALRDAIGHVVEVDGKTKWMLTQPRVTDYTSETAPHQLGAVLVAAVFDAFLQIYKLRIGNIIRLATGGTGLLPEGDLLHDLVERLAHEASKVAGQVLTMCIRALDYCPPVDLTFGDYLRAIVTADSDLVLNDKYGYRTAFVTAFRARGIYPQDVKYLSPENLMWESPALRIPSGSIRIPSDSIRRLLGELSLANRRNRELAYVESLENAKRVWHLLMDESQVADEEVAALGLHRVRAPEARTFDGVEGELRRIEVHSVRYAHRVGPDGHIRSDVVVEITQTFRPKNLPGVRHLGGCTLLIDANEAELRYVIPKKIGNVSRLRAQLDFAAAQDGYLRSNYFDSAASSAEPFALLHMGD
jgi:hypothetical protein